MKKLKFPLFMLAIAIALTASFAFKPTGEYAGKSTTYIYNSTSASLVDMQDTSNWDGVEVPEFCGETGSIPCVIDYDAEAEQMSFHDYLGSFTTAGALKNAADSRRTP